MSKHYLKAKLTSWRKINVVLFTDIPRPSSVDITLYKNGKFYKKEKISRINSIVQLYFFDISLDEDYELGASYTLLVNSLPLTNVDPSEAVDFDDFTALSKAPRLSFNALNSLISINLVTSTVSLPFKVLTIPDFFAA